MNENTVKNRRILIRNVEDGKIIADTKIIRFDSLTNSAYISVNSLAVRKYYNISAIVFAEECLYEFYGTIRGALVDNEIEVFLGKSKEKENRARTRYPIALEGSIVGIIIENKMIRLRKSMDIRTVNMSASGILIQAYSGCFCVGDAFFMHVETGNGRMEISCEVVRIQNSGMMTEEYGCKMKEVEIERETKQGSIR